MKTITYDTGAKGEFDDTFKPGDIITGYKQGFHEFVKYADTTINAVPLVYYRTKFSSNGKPVNAKLVSKCSASYCRRADIYIEKRLLELKQEEKALRAIAAMAGGVKFIMAV